MILCLIMGISRYSLLLGVQIGGRSLGVLFSFYPPLYPPFDMALIAQQEIYLTSGRLLLLLRGAKLANELEHRPKHFKALCL